MGFVGRVELSATVKSRGYVDGRGYTGAIDCFNGSWHTIPLRQFDLTQREKLSDSNLLR
jgi:hypothetical protein